MIEMRRDDDEQNDGDDDDNNNKTGRGKKKKKKHPQTHHRIFMLRSRADTADLIHVPFVDVFSGRCSDFHSSYSKLCSSSSPGWWS